MIKTSKRYNTPHRRRVVKTRMTDEEYEEFTDRLSVSGIGQSEFIRQCINKATIRPVITLSPINDAVLEQLGKLIAEYGKIGGNLNQIARFLNEYGHPYQELAADVRTAVTELSTLKYDVLKKVGDIVGNTETYRL